MNEYKVPNNLNVFLVVASCSASLSLLFATSYFTLIPLKLVCAILFAFTNNTVFSLLHEAVHGILHTNRKINYCLGVLLAAFFPTGFTLQSKCHLSHHLHNRDQAEQFDFIREGDIPILRQLQWYGILTGFYWVLLPLSSLLILLMPKLLFSLAKSPKLKGQASATGAEAMLEQIQNSDLKRVRLEILITLTTQIFFLYLIGFNWSSWLLCYAFFGINWSSLQYTDHAWSKLHRTDGAWDLKTHWLVQKFFLNYHLHRAHHQNPTLSWLYLPKFIDDKNPRPYFHKLYCLMWKGPQPIDSHELMYDKVIKKCL